MVWSEMLEDGRSDRKQRRSPAVCETVEDENIMNGASRLDFSCRRSK
jgi:hypothetical protein